MGMKEYVLWGGGLLVVLVVAHGLWQAWRSRQQRKVARAESEFDSVSGDTEQMDIFEPPVLNDVDDDTGGLGSVDVAADTRVAEESASVGEDATVGTSDVPGSEPSAGERPAAQGAATDIAPGNDGYAFEPEPAPEPESELEDDADGGKRGRRVVIPGKRTEPTVPRNDHLFKVRKSAPEPSRAPPAPPGLDHVVVIWVAAKEGTSFGGHALVKALADNGLRYGNDALFRKFDVDSGEELFSVVNGLEPGTFDLSDLEALSTPRIVMLMSLVNATTGLAAFSEMLDAAQDISISLGGELRDENMGPMTGQTIEHYRQRISDYKRKSLRK